MGNLPVPLQQQVLGSAVVLLNSDELVAVDGEVGVLAQSANESVKKAHFIGLGETKELMGWSVQRGQMAMALSWIALPFLS